MAKKKALIFDAGPLINLSMNGFLYLLPALKENFNGEFIITNQVKYEVIDRPVKIQRFELGALRISSLVKNKTISLPSSLKISDSEISKKTSELMNSINHLFESNGKNIEIVSEGEISCLALSIILESLGFETLIAIDERTTRLLSEKPQDLEDIISRKTHKHAKLKKSAYTKLSEFKNFKFIRSTELIYVAYKKGLLNINDPKALEASLYAAKFKGSSISWDEIKKLKKM